MEAQQQQEHTTGRGQLQVSLIVEKVPCCGNPHLLLPQSHCLVYWCGKEAQLAAAAACHGVGGECSWLWVPVPSQGLPVIVPARGRVCERQVCASAVSDRWVLCSDQQQAE